MTARLFLLLFVFNAFVLKAQTCDGNTFNPPGQPETCTYSYTASGWVDAFGNSVSAPTGLNSGSQSICILADNATDNFGTINGTLYVASGVTYLGSIGTFNGTLVAEGNINLTNAPEMSEASIYIDTNSTVNFPIDLIPGGTTVIHNAGTLNVAGNFSVGGQVSVINYSNAEIIVQGSITTNNILLNCGLLEVVTGNLNTGGYSGLQNFCVTYLHVDLNLNGDFYNEGLLIIDGGINFGSNIFYNNDMILANNFVMNNNQMIGNDESSILIVRNNAELLSNSIITGHKYFDIDDGGGFDSVCSSCTEDTDILMDVVVPPDINDITSTCNGNIQFNSPTPIAFIDFDGTDDYIDSSLDLSGTTQGAYMAWVKLAPDFTDSGVILSQGDFEISVIGGTNNVRVQLNSGILELPVSTALTLNEWTHIAVVYDASLGIAEQYKVYINGQQEGALGHATLASGLTTTTDLFTIGKSSYASISYFKGAIDEVRVLNESLTEDQLQQMVYQEIKNNSGNIIGTIVPKDILDFNTDARVSWSSLLAYYPMTDIFSYGKTSDFSLNNYIATMHNTPSIQAQTAPMPYQTATDGIWTDQTTWLHGNVWDIEDEPNNKDWCIVSVKNNVTTSNRHGTLGLLIDSGVTLTVNNDVELYNSWYLKLNGKIDLEGESQLVQSVNSNLDSTSSGVLERDQQGIKDLFTYNYWSSPVGISNTTSNNNSYTLPDVLNDGSVATSPLPINFLTSGYNGSPGTSGITPVGIADYWIWKYANKINYTYSEWQHIRSTGTILAGEGFSMKGVANTGTSFNELQNYVFNGKPNNGDITLSININNKYLVGNPYPSAIDANEFIKDNLSNLEVAAGGRNTNGNIINGVLYFWDHFASKTHVLSEYEGGYATYTLMGGTKAVSNDALINATLGEGTKTPERYIPVSQGFFVSTVADGLVTLTQPIVGGDIVFKNGQRLYKTEAPATSLFLKSSDTKSKSSTTSKSSEDIRQKIRLMFDSPRGYHRQLLVGVDEKTSNGFDAGFDAPLAETNKEDMYWLFDEGNFVIQAVNNFSLEQKLPLGVKIFQEGLASITIDELENIDSNVNIYLHDITLDTYTDLKESNHEVYLTPDTYTSRFEITFSKGQSLGIDEFDGNGLQVYYSNLKRSLVLHNPTLKDVKGVEIFNILGQSIYKLTPVKTENYQEFKTRKMSPGAYIIKVKTEAGSTSKKVLIK